MPGFTTPGPAGDAGDARALVERQGCDAAVRDMTPGRETFEAAVRELTREGMPFVVVSGSATDQLPRKRSGRQGWRRATPTGGGRSSVECAVLKTGRAEIDPAENGRSSNTPGRRLRALPRACGGPRLWRGPRSICCPGSDAGTCVPGDVAVRVFANRRFSNRSIPYRRLFSGRMGQGGA